VIEKKGDMMKPKKIRLKLPLQPTDATKQSFKLQQPSRAVIEKANILVFSLLKNPGILSSFQVRPYSVGVIIFGLIRFLSKKITKLKKKSKPNRNRIKPTGFGSVFRAKTGSNWFDSVFSGFFRFQFGFLLIKLKSNQPVFSKF
jgi:hypothetical protein